MHVGTSLAVDYRGVVLAHSDHLSLAAQSCGYAGGGAAGCTGKEGATGGTFMVANVPTVGVSTLYCTVFGDIVPYTCLAATAYLVVLAMTGEVLQLHSTSTEGDRVTE